MASFKKIRLDPDAPPNHRNVSNQPGANDTGGRSFLDGSSFSSSTSGGSGAYRRSAGPYRTRYSQPMGTPSPSSNSFSRFAPYYFGRERRTSLRVPLIRARRDDSDSEGYRPSSRASLNSSLGGDSTTSATSSTAQRIIETLQNLSTPVMNAGKIRIDQDIKAVQPLPFGGGTPLSRMSPGGSLNRATGPPKMCSSLMLSNPSPSNQINPMFNSGDQRRLFYIPRMVDVSTNTDKEEVSPSSQMHFSSKSSTPTKSPVVGSVALKPVVSTISSKDDNTSEEEYHECSSGFTFSNPWAPDTFKRYLSSPNEDKSISKGNAGTQQPMINGYKETVPTSLPNQMFSSKNAPSFPTSVGSSPSSSMPVSSPMKPMVSQSSGGFGGFQGGITKGFGASPLKDNTPLAKSGSSMSSEIKTNTPTMFVSGKIENNSSGKSVEINKSSSSTLPTFNFGDKGSSVPSSSSTSLPAKTFSFGGPSTSNDTKSSLSVDKVDAAKSENSSVAKSPLNSGTDSKKFRPLLLKSTEPMWRCSTCMVENEMIVPNCVCCSEKNPHTVPENPTTTTKKAIVSKKKWRCPTCMVENEPNVANCVCCSEKNPTPVSAPASTRATTATGEAKWKCPTCMVANSPTVAECVCCSEKNPNPISDNKKSSAAAAGSAPAPTFKFGISSSSNPVTSSSSVSSSTGSFVFGASKPAQSDISNASSSFKFGAPAASSNAPTISRPTPTVTSTSSQPTTTAVSAAQFSFGSNVSSSSTLPAVAERPSFGFPVPVSTNSQAASTANTTTTPSSNLFSAPKLSESNSVSSASAGGGSLFGSSNFQSPQTASSFNFSGTPATTSEAPKPTGPSFSFASSAGSKPAFGGNSTFGSSQQNQGSVQSGSTPSILSSAPAPAPSFSFGSNNNPAAPSSPFGAPIQFNSNPPSQSSAGGMFPMSGPMTARPLPPGPGAAPVPTFSLTPNLNFGVTPGSTIPFGNPTQATPNAGSQAPAPPALFQFGAPPTGSESPGGRKIKRAVRRFKN